MEFFYKIKRAAAGAAEKILTVHGDGPDGVLAEVLGHLQDELGLPVLHAQRVQDLRQTVLELDVDDGSDNGYDLTLGQHLLARHSRALSPL